MGLLDPQPKKTFAEFFYGLKMRKDELRLHERVERKHERNTKGVKRKVYKEKSYAGPYITGRRKGESELT